MSGAGLARAAVQGFLAELLVFPAGLITAAYLTRALGPADYGRIALIYAAIAPVAWLAGTTFAGRAGVKLLSDATDWSAMAATLLRANMLVGLGAATGFALLAPLIAAAMRRPELAGLLAIGAVEIAVLPLTRLHRDALVARGRYSWPALATAIYHGVRLGLVVGLVAAGWSIAGVVVANGAARLAELAVCRSRLPLPFRGAAIGGLGTARGFLGALFLGSLCLQLFNRIDVLLLGILRAPADTLGHYGAAQSLTQAPGLFALVFSPLLIAALRRADGAGDRVAAVALRRGSAQVALGAWALAAPVAAGASGLAHLIFGPGFAPAGPILSWLSIAVGAGLVVAIQSAHQVANGLYFRPVRAAAAMLALGATLAILWIPGSGGIGAARAMAAGSTAGALIATLAWREGAAAKAGLDLARAGLGGAAGFLSTRLATWIGVPPVADIAAGVLVGALALIGTGLISLPDLRRIGGDIVGRERPTPEPVQ